MLWCWYAVYWVASFSRGTWCIGVVFLCYCKILLHPFNSTCSSKELCFVLTVVVGCADADCIGDFS